MNILDSRSIEEWLGDRVDAVGVAPVERFAGAPDERRPDRLLEGAKSVVVLARALPRGSFHSPEGFYFTHGVYHTNFRELDLIGLDLARRLESAGHLAVVVPAYAPVMVREGRVWGLLSLKHAAVLAGLGSFSRSGLVCNETFGTLLRFSAVITTAPLEGSPLIEYNPCPPGCDGCREACPGGALDGDAFDRAACSSESIAHAIFRLALAQDRSPENLELVLNTAGYNYWLKCVECQRLCPLNAGRGG
jgi:epoxyqueuosine reductase